MATPDFRLRDDGETAGTPPTPSSDEDLDLAAPDALASFDVADATGAAGPGDLYDPSEDPNADANRLDDTAPPDGDALDAGTDDPATLDALRRPAYRENHDLGGYGEHGATDEILGDLTGDDPDFGPGSGTIGDTNSPSDER